VNREPISVLIVEDHAIVRRGLKEIIADEYPRAVFGEAADSSTALQEFLRGKWDIVLLDISIPGRGGLEILEDVRRTHPQTRVLIVSAYPEEEFAVRAFKLGAAGYVCKNQASGELVEAVKTVLSGRKYVTLSLAQRLADAVSGGAGGAPHETLSPRELQVLRLVAAGKTLKEIAAELALSGKTVETYRARIAEKTGLSSNVELTRYAFHHGLAQ
jgi:two-component system invasion response regulator UvrY